MTASLDSTYSVLNLLEEEDDWMPEGDEQRECLKMYVNGMGFRGIERVKGVHHTTVVIWVK